MSNCALKIQGEPGTDSEELTYTVNTSKTRIIFKPRTVVFRNSDEYMNQDLRLSDKLDFNLFSSARRLASRKQLMSYSSFSRCLNELLDKAGVTERYYEDEDSKRRRSYYTSHSSKKLGCQMAVLAHMAV